jgi:hypothetical protein
MTREEVVALVQSFLKKYEIDSSPGLNKNDLGGILVDGAQLYFEYTEDSLVCSALIYRFKKIPNPKVLAALKQEEKLSDTGGGQVDFQPENQCVFLTRIYKVLPDSQEFLSDMQALMSASITWNSEVMDRAFTTAQTGSHN